MAIPTWSAPFVDALHTAIDEDTRRAQSAERRKVDTAFSAMAHKPMLAGRPRQRHAGYSEDWVSFTVSVPLITCGI